MSQEWSRDTRHDLVIRNARLPFSAAPVDIGIAGGRIAAFGQGLACDGVEVDAAGRLVTGGLVDTHIHLDKAGIIGRCSLCEGTLAEAVRETSKAKAAFTEADVHARAARVVEAAITHGTMRMRTFCEIDPRAGFRSFAALKRIRDDYARHIDIEICAFAQEGLANDPGTEAMLDAALADGADLVGGCPYTDTDPRGHIDRIFDLAQKYDVDVDFHVDFDLDPSGSNLPGIIEETERRGYGGRVSIGHVTKLSAMAPEDRAAMVAWLTRAGIALTVLPATDLFLLGRAADRLVPRGMAATHGFRAAGLVATLATNNVMNPFTPFGDASLMRMANLYANIAQAGTPGDLDGIFAMVSGDAARLMRAPDPAPAVGGPADLVLWEAETVAEAVATIAPARAGWRAGVPSFERGAAKLV